MFIFGSALVKLLWNKTTLKYLDYLLLVLAVVAAVFFAYKWLYDRAYEAGVTDTKAVYQPVIDKFNAEVTQRNDKITGLESLSKTQGDLLRTMPTLLSQAKQSALDAYIAKHPQSKVKPAPNQQVICGFDADAAATYNQFILTH